MALGNGLGTSVTRAYDAMHRLRSETLFHDTQTITLSHDIDGAAGLSTLTYSAGLGVVMEFHPDLNVVEDVVIDGVRTFHYEYEGPGRVSTRDTTPGGASSWRLDYDYDVNRQLTLHDHTFVAGGASGNRIAGFAYDHDGLHRQGSVLRLHEGLGDQYEYDGLSQLEKIRYDVPAAEINNPTTTSFGLEASYVYDQTENRVVASKGGLQEIYTVDPCDNVYTAIDGVALLYDANGNLTDDGTYLYTYDFANRLVQVESQSNVVITKFAYDALGRRIRKEVVGEYTRIYMWSGSRLMEQREDQDLDGTYERVRQLVYGPAIDDVIQIRIDGVPYFPITDGLGSVVALVDAAGTTVETYEYDAWGRTTIYDHSTGSPVLVASSPLGNPSLWTGREWDSECELYYNRARYYSPRIGRFITRDPIGLEGGRNLYAYTANNPINLTDPSGHQIAKNHYEFTYDAVFAAQMQYYLEKGYNQYQAEIVSKADAMEAAQASVDWDNDDIHEGTQDAENAHWHGMKQVGEEREHAFEAMWSKIEEMLQNGNMDMKGLGAALHMIQDVLSGGHGLEQYEGMTSLVIVDIVKSLGQVILPGIAPRPHWMDDRWPRKATRTMIKGLSNLMASGNADLVKRCLQVILGLPEGVGGTVERHKDGSVTITLPDGTIVAIDKRGRVTVTEPEEEEGGEGEGDEDTIETNDDEEIEGAGGQPPPPVERGPATNPVGEVVPLNPADGR